MRDQKSTGTTKTLNYTAITLTATFSNRCSSCPPVILATRISKATYVMNLRRIPRPRPLDVTRDHPLFLQLYVFLNPHQVARTTVQVRGCGPEAHEDLHGAAGVIRHWHGEVCGTFACCGGEGWECYPGVEALGEGADEGVFLGMDDGKEGEGGEEEGEEELHGYGLGMEIQWCN